MRLHPICLQTVEHRLQPVQRRKVDAFEGAVFASLPGETRRPALILLGGSEGGSAITHDAAAWASRGYAVLALPYYSPPGWGPTGPTPPELPSLRDAGVNNFELEVWTALVGPASLSKAAQDRLAREVPAALREADTRQRLFSAGWSAQGTAPEALRLRVRSEAASAVNVSGT